jgi:RNA polymerase sigma-70 factor (ECF subfamily)
MKARAHALAQDAEPQAVDEGAEMLARHMAGDSRAFEELVDRYAATVYGYLARAGLQPPVADDLFQEAFMRVHAHARRYDDGFPFRVWLITITNNLIRSHFRKARVRRILVGWWRGPSSQNPHAEPEPLDPADEAPAADRVIEARDRARWLEQAMQELPEGPRRALVLTRVEGLSQEEASRVLGVPVPTVKTWVRRGRLMLAEALEKAEEGDRS